MFWAFIVICLVLLFGVVKQSTVMGGKEQDITFSQFLEKVQQGQVNDVAVVSTTGEVHGHFKNDGKEAVGFHTTAPSNYPDMYNQLNTAKIQYTVKDASGNNILWTVL